MLICGGLLPEKRFQRAYFSISIYVLVIFESFTSSSNLLISTQFENALQRLSTEALGVKNMQEYYDKQLIFTKERIDGSTIIPELAAAISRKFKDRIETVKKLKTAVEVSYNSDNPSGRTQCCKLSTNLEFDSRFRTKTAANSACSLIAKESSSDARHLGDNVIEAMKKNLEEQPSLKWQYFGSEKGVTTQFPASKSGDCSSYDNRFRPWYVETATPIPKHVVIVIDKSGSMGTSLMNIAKDAAKTVLDTLNPRDKVGVVAFSNQGETFLFSTKSLCYRTELAKATPSNIAELKIFVDSLRANGGTYYGNAFTKAFDLLYASKPRSGSNTKQVILFLTDGYPSDSSSTFMTAIKDGNTKLNNKVVIITFGLGSNVPDSTLRNIANQDNLGTVESSQGKYIAVRDSSRLRSDMTLYYDAFSKDANANDVVISVPYLDSWGLGLITTVSLPCHHNGKFIGVIGVDITMSDLLADVTYFSQGQSSYAFLVDRTDGRTMMHPLLPVPSSVTEPPLFIDVRSLETEYEFNSTVYPSIESGANGKRILLSKRFLPRGGAIKEGVKVVEINSTYYWHTVENTQFSVGLVIALDDHRDTLSKLTPNDELKTVYHRLDLQTPESPCKYFGRYVVKEHSSIKLAPGSFKNPYEYLGLMETKSKVNAYTSYFNDKSSSLPNPGLKDGIRDSVLATAHADSIWLKERTKLIDYLVWRYIGTSDGVMRTIPGHIYQKNYDPRKRSWYQTAISNIGRVSLSTPYVDISGAGVVITAAQTIFVGSTSNHTTADDVAAVMGADMPLTYFSKLLKDTYPQCKQSDFLCFVMDNAGFLIMHDDFLHPKITAKTVELIHITQKERNVAIDLITNGYLRRKECQNLEKIKNNIFWEVNVPAGVNKLNSDSYCTKYQIEPVAGSNAYVGIIDKRSGCPSTSCSCSSECAITSLPCECPCLTTMNNFKYCESRFTQSSDAICPVPETLLAVEEIEDPSTKGLSKCYDAQCGKKINVETCEGVVSCSWCVIDEQSQPLTKPYCTDINLCYGGQRGVKPPGARDRDEGPEDNPKQPKSSLSTGAIAGIVFGVLAAVIVTCVLYKKCQKSNPANQSSDNRVTQSPPAQVHHLPYGQPNFNDKPYVIPSENPPPYSAAVGYYNNAHASAPPYNPVVFPPNVDAR